MIPYYEAREFRSYDENSGLDFAEPARLDDIDLANKRANDHFASLKFNFNITNWNTHLGNQSQHVWMIRGSR